MSRLTRTILRSRAAAQAVSSFNRGLGTAGLKLVPSHTLDEAWVRMLLYLGGLIETIDGVAGDIVECGVASGNSFAMLAALNRHSNPPRRLWGFDSWQGLPTPLPEDVSTPSSAATRGAFSASHEDLVFLRLEQYGFKRSDLGHATLVRGPFAETLPRCPVDQIALLHLDVDLYDSYRTCLTHLWPKVVPNGIVAFDEYGLDDAWPGARLAVDEFFADKPGQLEMQRDPRASRHYAIKRVDPPGTP